MPSIDNSLQISEKFKKLRIDRVNSWKPNLIPTSYDYLFPIEISFLNRINDKLNQHNLKIFTPLYYPYNLDKDYNTYISFLIESLDLMPLKVDLSFDFSWKGFEMYLGKAHLLHSGQTITNISDLIKYARANYLLNFISTNPILLGEVENFIRIMPAQSQEFLAKRMFDSYTNNNPKSSNVYRRLGMSNGAIEPTIDSIYKDIFAKYGVLDSGDKTRKVGRLLYRLLIGDEISLPRFDNLAITSTYILSIKEKIDIIINGLLFTYRNDRFHGNTFSPFKSSKASIQTYALAHYHFLWSYFLANITQLYLNDFGISIAQVEDNIRINAQGFEMLYGNHLTR